MCEERRILHSVWTDGLDEEDAALLRRTYQRLQEQDDGVGWLSDTLWTPHPHILSPVDVEHRISLKKVHPPKENSS